jgi:hypothetical protein
MSWYGLRDYGCFEIEYTVETRDRQEDNMGDLTGYGKPYRTTEEMRIIAPTEGMAIAYMESMNQSNDPVVIGVKKLKIDGVVLAMNS